MPVLLCKNKNGRTFEDLDDEKQFQTIYEQINECEFIKSLLIPSELSKEIAEYSTGKIEICNNDDCENEILLFFY